MSGATPRTERKLTDSSRERYREFKEMIAGGMHPKTAAETLGDMKYTKLRGAKDLFEVRLNGKDRVLFRLDEAKAEVTILQAGGHT